MKDSTLDKSLFARDAHGGSSWTWETFFTKSAHKMRGGTTLARVRCVRVFSRSGLLHAPINTPSALCWVSFPFANRRGMCCSSRTIEDGAAPSEFPPRVFERVGKFCDQLAKQKTCSLIQFPISPSLLQHPYRSRGLCL